MFLGSAERRFSVPAWHRCLPAWSRCQAVRALLGADGHDVFLYGSLFRGRCVSGGAKTSVQK